MARTERRRPGPSFVLRRVPRPPMRLALLGMPIAALSVLSAIGNAAAPRLLSTNPLLLAALAPRAVHLVVAAGAVPFPTFFVVGLIRLAAADPWHYALGRRYGPAVAASGGPGGRVARWVARFDERGALLAVCLCPTGKALLVAGACGARPGPVAGADVAGTALQLTALYFTGRPLVRALDPSPTVLTVVAAAALAMSAAGAAILARTAQGGRTPATDDGALRAAVTAA